MDIHLLPVSQTAWMIEGDCGSLGELRMISGLFVIIPAHGSPLDDVKGGYGSQSAAINAIMGRTGGECHLRKSRQ